MCDVLTGRVIRVPPLISAVPVPGYDPDDIEDWLQELVSGVDAGEVLDDEELAAYRDGERLEDVLSSRTIAELRERR